LGYFFCVHLSSCVWVDRCVTNCKASVSDAVRIGVSQKRPTTLHNHADSSRRFINRRPRKYSKRSSTLFQPRLWPSRDSSPGNCSCFNRKSVPPLRSEISTVTILIRFSQSSSSQRF